MAGTDNIINVSEADFEYEVIQQSFDTPVVVDFLAPWCGPCRMLTPILEKLAADPNHIFILAKINVDESPNIAMRFRVQGIPAVKAFRDGEVVGEFSGAMPEQRVRQFIQKIAPSTADNQLSEANSLLATRHWSEAETAYRRILSQHPYHPVATLNLARALLAQGEGCEAIRHLKAVTDGPELILAQKLLPLGNYLCQTSELTAGWEDDVPLIEIQYRQVSHIWERANFAAAMDGLLDVLRQDKNYGEAKAVLLAIFELLGDVDPLTQTYRRELASVLF
ncbi:MAG: tetratricopeptide repeat protein [Ardenticatenaceae bacterium]|nr:tetratricopeptide repeat protein [Ardenticatenaceae bacterium]MCB9445540.1 tetratricopeptide repeat protein [Ardenticatenaceae bacterium]